MRPGFVYVAALAGVHAMGAAVLIAFPRSWRDRPPLFPATALFGALALTVEMFLMTVLGIPWSIPGLVAVPLALAIAGALRRRTPPAERQVRVSPGGLARAFALLLVAYAAVTGRATSMDLLLFWGVKAERFALMRTVDLAFLRDPLHYLLHPDYPPLLPFLNGFGAMAAGRFPWGASLLVMPWFLAVTATAYHAGVRDRMEPPDSGWLTAVFTAALGLAAVAALTAGNADMILIAYETGALALLLRCPVTPPARWAAGAILAGACLVKIEGAFFAAITVAAFVLTHRREDRGRAVIALALPPTIALGAWVLFCRFHGLLDFYAGGKIGSITLQNLGRIPPAMLKAASYDCFFVPWIALAVAAFALRPKGLALFPLVVAAGLIAVNVFFYLHGSHDPSEWIGWSAGRTLMTVLVCGFLAIGGDGARDGPAATGL